MPDALTSRRNVTTLDAFVDRTMRLLVISLFPITVVVAIALAMLIVETPDQSNNATGAIPIAVYEQAEQRLDAEQALSLLQSATKQTAPMATKRSTRPFGC